MRRPRDYPNRITAPLALAVSLLTWAMGLYLLPSASLTVDPGGSIRLYAQRAATYTGPLPLDCRSACTMYLAHGCVTPGHRLTFHTPTPDTSYWRQLMADHYPVAIAAWFMRLPKGRATYVISGAEAASDIMRVVAARSPCTVIFNASSSASVFAMYFSAAAS